MRKPISNIMPISSSIFAVMKGRPIAGSESIQHKMHMTDLDHRRTRFDTALIVLTVAPIPPMPRVCALNHPEFRQRCEALYGFWTCFHLDAPPGPMRGHPGVQRGPAHMTQDIYGKKFFPTPLNNVAYSQGLRATGIRCILGNDSP